MRFRALDGWRGIAALLVAVYHLQFYNHLQELDFIRNSFLFVDFFFVLSGFVIGHAYIGRIKTKRDIISFVLRRVGRLWPLHLFILFLFVILELIKLYLLSVSVDLAHSNPAFVNEYSVNSIFSNVSLIHSLGIHNTLTWNYPSWSISVEFYTYLVFLISTLLFKSSNIIKIALIATSLLILYIIPTDLNNATYDYGIFRCITGFFLGLLTYRFYKKYPDIKLKSATLVELVLILSVTLFIIYFAHGGVSLFAPFLFVIMVYVFSLEQGAVSEILKINILQKLGEWSYSIYMVHALLLIVISRVIVLLQNKYNFNMFYSEDNPINSLGVDTFYIKSVYFMDLLTIFYLVALIAISAITYYFIEKKGIKLFRRLEDIYLEKVKPKQINTFSQN